MEVRLEFLNLGEERPEYSQEFDLPAIPREGDYVRILMRDKQGQPLKANTEDFLVKRTCWHLDRAEDGFEAGTCQVIAVICEASSQDPVG